MIDRVLIVDVEHLTDARYYAARGVYGIAYRYAEASAERLARIHAILEWVEGPRSYLDMRHFMSDLYPDIREFYGILGDHPGLSEDQEKIEYHPPAYKSSRARYIPLQIEDIEHQKELLREDPNLYLILSGSPEDEIGLKDYTEIDDILDRLA